MCTGQAQNHAQALFPSLSACLDTEQLRPQERLDGAHSPSVLLMCVGCGPEV